MKVRLLAAAAALALSTAPPLAHAQGDSTCHISSRDPIVFFDKLGAAFNRLDSALVTDLAAGRVTLDERPRMRLANVTVRVRNGFEQIEAKRSARGLERGLWDDLGAYNDFVNLAYRPKPPAINALVCPLMESYLRVVWDQLQDHERRFHVRYGASSERLNIVEILLTEIFQEPRAMGALRNPGRLEPIARAQLFGFEYDRATEKVRPSSPIYQGGFSWYLYGDNKVSRALNHLGVAFAYQKDLVTKADLRGGVLHVRTWDIGLLCPTSGCDDGIIVGSKNLSAFGEAWTKLRKKLHGTD